MIRPRLIPCLLIHKKGLVKTIQFKNPKYVGDPLNAVRIFNEKEVDELIVLDIDASRENRAPNFTLVSQLASECNMPLCYGGGINDIEQIQELVSLGVEKVALGAAAIEKPDLVNQAVTRVGSQSVAVVIDVAKTGILKRPEVLIRNATVKTGKTPLEVARKAVCLGAGELIINSIDNDGSMKGYDLPLIRKIMSQLSIPVTCLGGAGDLSHVKSLCESVGLVGAAAGSMFVFKGKYRAVLINYPNAGEKKDFFSMCQYH